MGGMDARLPACRNHNLHMTEQPPQLFDCVIVDIMQDDFGMPAHGETSQSQQTVAIALQSFAGAYVPTVADPCYLFHNTANAGS
jgi:hypothetical protein